MKDEDRKAIKGIIKEASVNMCHSSTIVGPCTAEQVSWMFQNQDRIIDIATEKIIKIIERIEK